VSPHAGPWPEWSRADYGESADVALHVGLDSVQHALWGLGRLLEAEGAEPEPDLEVAREAVLRLLGRFPAPGGLMLGAPPA